MDVLTAVMDRVAIEEKKFRDILHKQANIEQLFPTFKDRVAAISHGELFEEEPGLLHFKVEAVTTPGVDNWDVYVQFLNMVQNIKMFGQRKDMWKKDGSGIDLDKLAEKILRESHMRIWCSCLTGDTKVPLLDGRVLTMEELVLEYGVEKEFWVYASDENGDFVPAKARCLGQTGIVSDLIQVGLDNGESIKCTPDHRFRMRDGTYKSAYELQSGDSLMPLYREVNSFGYEHFKMNSKDSWVSTHKRVAETVLREEVSKIVGKYNTHHKNEIKLDNVPENLQPMSAADHWKKHSNEAGFRLREWERSVKGTPTMRVITSRKGKACWEKHPEENLRNLRQGSEVYQHSVEGKEAMKVEMKRRWQVPEIRARMGSGKSNPWSAERKANHKASLLGLDRSKLSERMALLNKTVVRDALGHNNHKVVGIIRVVRDNAIPVYDLTVEKYGNFALQAGVFVHNCPANQYWGFAYIQTLKQTKYGDPENRRPTVKNTDMRGTGCKHLQYVFNLLPGYKATIASHLNRFFNKDIKKVEAGVKGERAKFKGAAVALQKKEEAPAHKPVSYGRGGKPVETPEDKGGGPEQKEKPAAF